MWSLKYKYKHSDCIFSDKIKELGLDSYFFYLGEYAQGGFIYTTSMIQLFGEEKSIKKYIDYLKQHKNIKKIEVQDNILFTLASHKKELVLYGAVYDKQLIHSIPVYIDEDGYEITEIVCWDRKPLEKFILSLEKNKTTEYFEILHFKQKKFEELYVAKLFPKLSTKQKQAITLALKNNYYSFPRKVNLDKLSSAAKVSKQTFRENLRKAEEKIIPRIVSK